MSAKRARPQLDADNRPFWTGGAEGKLNIMRCGDCREFTHPPRQFCRHCLSENMAPFAVSGRGTVDTFTINHQPWGPGMEVPFIIARVKLDDAPGVYLTTNIVEYGVDEIDFDDPVEVVFEQQEEIYYPLFRKRG